MQLLFFEMNSISYQNYSYFLEDFVGCIDLYEPSKTTITK